MVMEDPIKKAIVEDMKGRNAIVKDIIKRKVIRQGLKKYRNYTITIPKFLAQIHGIEEGMEIELKDTEEGLVILYPDRKEEI